DTVSVMRFRRDSIVVRVGDAVEWTNLDPVTAHTVTFGDAPSGPPQPPSAGVTVDSDGARHALLASPGGSVHSKKRSVTHLWVSDHHMANIASSLQQMITRPTMPRSACRTLRR